MSCCNHNAPKADAAQSDCCAATRALPPRPTEAPRAGVGGGLSVGGSVVAAVLSSACCWLPLLLIALGASAGGVSVFFERWRPVFAVVALALLAVGFYFVYFRKAACDDGSCARPSRGARVTSHVILWIAAAFVGAFVLFPSYAGSIARAIHGSPQAGAASPTDATLVVHHFRVEGMSCEACAVTLQVDLAGLEGVSSAEVDYATKTATVRSAIPDLDSRVAKAAEQHGYHTYPR